MIGAAPLQPGRERMSSSGLLRPENTTLSGGITHPCHLQGQSSTNTHEKAIIAELHISKMGNLVLAI